MLTFYPSKYKRCKTMKSYAQACRITKTLRQTWFLAYFAA
jgi:hypothetical protein